MQKYPIFYKSIITLLIFLTQATIWSQTKDTTKNISFSAKYSYGYIYPHHKSFEYFINNYVTAFETNIGFKTKGEKKWQQLYNYPTIGIGYYFANLGNPELFGYVNTIYPFISVPIIDKDKIKVSYTFSEGIAWINKKFDLYNNNYNFVIGSHLNVYINIGLETEIKINSKLDLILSFDLSHFSNGGTKQPNKGFNLITLQSGIKYNLHEEDYKIKNEIPNFTANTEYSIVIAGGFKNLPPAKTTFYPVSSIMINAKRQFSYKGKIGIGIDLFFDKSRVITLIYEGIENPTNAELFYGGSHLSYDFVYGKMSFTTQFGIYLLRKARFYQTTYNRFGLSYKFENNLTVNIHLKTFWAAADFIEYGIGYRL